MELSNFLTKRQDQCIHPPLVIAMKDGQLQFKEARKMRYHISQCKSCRKTFDEVTAQYQKINDVIPKINSQCASINEIKSEVKEVIKYAQKNNILKPPFIRKWYQFLLDLEKELTGIIFSKGMIKYYMISIVMVITFKILK